MSAWVLTIVGVILLTLVVEVVLPEGETAKYIKTIFAVVCVLVVVSPVVTLLQGGVSWEKIFGGDSITLNEEMLWDLELQKVGLLEQRTEQQLANNGYEGVKVTFDTKIDGYSIIITGAQVNLKNLVIKQDVQHTNVSENIKKLVLTVIDVPLEKVVIV